MSNIKSYTTNFSMKIPEFNIATWHDAMEYNFTLIDALLGNFFEINNFKGPWLIVTSYHADDIIYIDAEDDQYVGKIFKVLQDHISGNTSFEEFYTEHPEYYEEYADMNGVVNYFNTAKDYAIKMDGKVIENGTETDYSSKYYANESANSATLAGEHETNALSYKQDAESAKNSAESYATSAQGYMNNAEQYKDDALSYKNSAGDSATLATQAKTDAQSAANSASSSQTGAETAEQNAQGYATSASGSATAAYNSEIAAQTARDDAKSWAIGLPSEPLEHSAKYWAELAATYVVQPDWNQNDSTKPDYIKNRPLTSIAQISVNTANIGDLSQLSTDEKNNLVAALNEVNNSLPDFSLYATKTWVESQGYLTTIDTNLIETALGYTPVSPTGLATVSFTGLYDDLNNKPTIPNVYNSTITFTQGGVTKGSFTLNQATDATIVLDAGGSGGSSLNIDGGVANSVYTSEQIIDGGEALWQQ